MTPVTIHHNAGGSRVEAHTEDGRVAGFASYAGETGTLTFFHTEVDPAFEGQGIGGQLARGVFDWVRGQGMRIDPTCPFLAGWVLKHPEYGDLLVD